MSTSGGQAPAVTIETGLVTDINATSGQVANAAAVAAIPAAVGKTSFITGLELTSDGATAAAIVDVTVNLGGVTLHYAYTAVAGASTADNALILTFPRPLPATAANTAITVTCPALGAGNLNAAVNVHGYQQ